jgi:hypothetical protein
LGPLKRLFADKSGGNAFFIEELVQGVSDEGVLMRNGGVRMTRPLGQVRIGLSSFHYMLSTPTMLPRGGDDSE